MDSSQPAVSTTQRRLAALREARRQQQRVESTTAAQGSAGGLGAPSTALATLKAGILERAASRDATPLNSARRSAREMCASPTAAATDDRPRTLSMLAAIRDDDAVAVSSPQLGRGSAVLADYLQVPLAHSSTRALMFHLENDMRERILSEWSLSLTMTLVSQQRRDLRLLSALAARASAAEAAQAQAETALAAERASRAEDMTRLRAECDKRALESGELYQTEIAQLKATVATLEESLKTAHAAAATAAASAAAAAAANAAAVQIAAATAAATHAETSTSVDCNSPAGASSLRDVLVQRQRDATHAINRIRGIEAGSPTAAGRARSSSVRLDSVADAPAVLPSSAAATAESRAGRVRAGTIAFTRAASPDFVAAHFAATSAVPPPPPPPPESESDRYLRSIMDSVAVAGPEVTPAVAHEHTAPPPAAIPSDGAAAARHKVAEHGAGSSPESQARTRGGSVAGGARSALELLADGNASDGRPPSRGTSVRTDRFVNAQGPSDVRLEHRCTCSVSLMRGKAPAAFTGGPGNIYIPIRCIIAAAGVSLYPTAAEGAPPFSVPFRFVTRFRPISSGALQGLVVSFTGASCAGTAEVWWSVRDERSSVIAKLRSMCPNAAS